MIRLWPRNVLDVICFRAYLAQMQMPQPVNPELSCWPVAGILDTLNNFRGKGQPCGDQDYASLELPRKEPSFIVILFFLK